MSIDAHIDSVKFSGGLIAGLSLHADRVMILRKSQTETDTETEASSSPINGEDKLPDIIKIILTRRSFYILSGPLRYSYSHEILGENSNARSLSLHTQASIYEKRFSIILRDELD